jgi:hypothetical protein
LSPATSLGCRGGGDPGGWLDTGTKTLLDVTSPDNVLISG